MSLREELNRAIDAADHYDRNGVMPTWARMALTKFVGNHGQALLEALEDAERYRWLRTLTSFEAEDFYGLGGPKTDDEFDEAVDSHHRNTTGQDIDAAIKGDGAKPTP